MEPLYITIYYIPILLQQKVYADYSMIYIYIYRERERERVIEKQSKPKVMNSLREISSASMELHQNLKMVKQLG